MVVVGSLRLRPLRRKRGDEPGVRTNRKLATAVLLPLLLVGGFDGCAREANVHWEKKKIKKYNR